jgi:GNAT superfamily N-acetyltransferase
MFRIVDADAETGCFAIHEGGLLTLFHVRREQQRLGQQLLKDIRQKHEIGSALVPTCDEFFLSHVLDEYRELKMQAYFFTDSGKDPASPPGAADVQYRLARPTDAATITAVGGDFLEDAADRISRNEVTVGLLGREIVSIGLIIPNRLLRRHASIGMFTVADHRRRGIGTRTILHLKRLCRAQGITPVAGCGYGNRASKATLEAAGMVTRTRLLRIGF